ncbi:DUF3182 family protein [Pseudomonas sp. CDFA 602]|uniref:DUF3182 family protein n=1 Tax=Pseudomonas californiensis TaxID=2829823 RepID=UPI001E4F65D4|nr:DUF3182 family protein [Pseudomonas californiensis]MCD5996609.1 DUF3182 family protein [Pseudomonas californiensis]MCD6002214.1 DUF3182 family protein [Pseudomonas californiensis]
MTGTRTRKTYVVLLPTHKTLATHEVVTHQALAEKLATLLGAEFAGLHDSAIHQGPGIYYVPSDTLVGKDHPRQLDIQSEDDLFGGLIAEPFMATKALSHALPDDATSRTPGWSEDFHRQAADAVLAGFTAFNKADALQAGERMLADGPVRVKPVLATAGRGQVVVSSLEALQEAVSLQDIDEVNEYGLVLEENLQDVVTYSVGQVRVAGTLASYYGTQSLTTDNQGETVYGGSHLHLVRGEYEALLQLDLDDAVRQAVQQALAYEKAAFACFPGFIASRRNYDIAQGTNSRGQRCSGVLEQSWRIGGASPAEIEALLRFAANPELQQVEVTTHEVYGKTSLPAGAQVLYEGDDPQVGFITKFIQVGPHERQQ